MIGPMKIARAVAGVVVVLILGVVVLNWYNDFKAAPPQATTQTTPAAVSTSTEPGSLAASGTVVVGVVKTGGLNFRTKPSSAATLIRALKKGEKLTVLAKDGTWYQVKDAKGRTGWVTASADYIVIQKQ